MRRHTGNVYFTIYAWLSYVLCLLVQNDATCRWLEIIAETCTTVCLCIDNCNSLVIKLFMQLPCLTLRPSISGFRNSVLPFEVDFIPYEFSFFVSVLLDKLLDRSLLFCMGVKFCIYISPRSGMAMGLWNSGLYRAHCPTHRRQMTEWRLSRKTPGTRRKTCPSATLSTKKIHLNCPGSEPRFERREAGH